MPVNKVDFGGKNLIDLTNDTVTAESLKKDFTAHDKAGNLITGILESSNISSPSKIAVGTLSFPSEKTIQFNNPLIIKHSLKEIPNFLALFVTDKIGKTQGHDFFSIVANDVGQNISIKASYYSGRYPELYLYTGNGQMNASSNHQSRRSFLDVWGATEEEIKIGAYRDVSASLYANTDYTWIVGKI